MTALSVSAASRDSSADVTEARSTAPDAAVSGIVMEKSTFTLCASLRPVASLRRLAATTNDNATSTYSCGTRTCSAMPLSTAAVASKSTTNSSRRSTVNSMEPRTLNLTSSMGKVDVETALLGGAVLDIWFAAAVDALTSVTVLRGASVVTSGVQSGTSPSKTPDGEQVNSRATSSRPSSKHRTWHVRPVVAPSQALTS